MTLLVTIFLLVLLTEVIEWIGKPVLLQLVGQRGYLEVHLALRHVL